ncbi:EscU/YscU/HrcU family type III secretion system export apparatus switch protein, partial [bacterium]|nr:EscU/YscU/HrcU family type III secretion system export apparatus switch protein [bacterium]
KTLFELLKNIAKVLVLGWIGWSVYTEHIKEILQLSEIDNNFAVMILFGKIVTDFIFKACIAFLVISAADYMVTRWKFLKDQKMSFKEIKDEYKNTEGDPNVKAQLRQRRAQLMQRNMMDSVAEADFVVRNPIHIACALKYDAEKMDSPMLIAKGTELIAQKIIKIAEEHSVPVVSNPPVARALFRMVELNHLIPIELYKAVAEILLFVYDLKNKQNQGRIIENTNPNLSSEDKKNK